jgi:hypothetical protein
MLSRLLLIRHRFLLSELMRALLCSLEIVLWGCDQNARIAGQSGYLFNCFLLPALQAVTLVVWTAARYFLYASYFTIFGVLFGFKNFGKMVAIDNTFNGLIGAKLLFSRLLITANAHEPQPLLLAYSGSQRGQGVVAQSVQRV